MIRALVLKIKFFRVNDLLNPLVLTFVPGWATGLLNYYELQRWKKGKQGKKSGELLEKGSDDRMKRENLSWEGNYNNGEKDDNVWRGEIKLFNCFNFMLELV